MGWKTKPVAIGDRFARNSQPSRVFVVAALDERPGMPRHARLKAEDDSTEQITIAVSALSDPALYRRL